MGSVSVRGYGASVEAAAEAAQAAELGEREALRAQVAALEAARADEAAARASKREQQQHIRSTSPHSPGGRRCEVAALQRELSLQQRESAAMRAQHAVALEFAQRLAAQRKEAVEALEIAEAELNAARTAGGEGGAAEGADGEEGRAQARAVAVAAGGE